MKNVLITGGSRGIGRAIVETFVKAGYKVAFTYKNSESEALKLADATGALALRADSSCEGDVINAVNTAKEINGSIDILVNNAGVSETGLLTDLSLERWNDIFATNVNGLFLYSKYIIPQMLNKKQGRIISISSIWGLVGASCEVAYSASKAAVIGFGKALAKELGPSGITVNTIAPGVISTDMNSALSESDIVALKEETPLMRIGCASDVAATALFLASEGASFITGEVINVSGGFVI